MDILRLNTLRSTKPAIVTTETYDEHPPRSQFARPGIWCDLVRGTLYRNDTHHNNHVLFKTLLYLFSLPILESYDAKVEFGWLLSREISVEDELSTCMWLKLGEGNWNEEGDFVWPVWLQMKGMNMLTSIKGEADGLILQYVHGGIVQK